VEFDDPDIVDVSLMLVGDSITHGSTGDWTWRYRLWKHLRANHVAVNFVGPRKSLDRISSGIEGDEDMLYQDPGFNRHHAAQWGQPYLVAKTTIGDYVATYRPDFVLVLLGINDIAWYGVTPDEFEASVREFIANARAARHGVRLIVGTILETGRASAEPEFGKRVSACNERLRAVAAELHRPLAPVEVAETAAEFVASKHTWDDTHPNPSGEILIAAAFADALAHRFHIGARYPRLYPVLENIPSDFKCRS
jgi:lysophospholipase L1-like esterase